MQIASVRKKTMPISVDDVDRAVHDTPYMTLEQARTLQRLWNSCPPGDLLELGFAYGKGSAYLGALAAQKGQRAVCVDNLSARDRQPRADSTIGAAGVADHVDLLFTDNGYVWWMKQQLEEGDSRRYSLVYLDGAHDWFVDGFAALLLDRFLIPGGVLVLDDLDWSFASSAAPDIMARVSSMTADVASEPQVRKVWELLLQTDPRWGEFEEHDGWGIARKLASTDARRPLERVVVRPSASSIVGSATRQARQRLLGFASRR
jgi:predicted O-methyltransferase YrrM